MLTPGQRQPGEQSLAVSPRGLAAVIEDGVAGYLVQNPCNLESRGKAGCPWSHTRRIQVLLGSFGAPLDPLREGRELGVCVVVVPLPLPRGGRTVEPMSTAASPKETGQKVAGAPRQE